MQYQVPQFIEVEDKLIGPLTLKQALYILGGIGSTVLLWRMLPHYLAMFFIIPIDALAAALAFYKVNDRPFIDIMEAGFMYYIGDRLYLWAHDYTPKESAAKSETKPEVPAQNTSIPKINEGKLRDIAWSLDIRSENK